MLAGTTAAQLSRFHGVAWLAGTFGLASQTISVTPGVPVRAVIRTKQMGRGQQTETGTRQGTFDMRLTARKFRGLMGCQPAGCRRLDTPVSSAIGQMSRAD